VKVKKRCQFKISNIVAAFENLNIDVKMNRAWESIRENVRLSVTGY
jgi:hypothetical protein